MLLSDREIIERAYDGMISPFVDKKITNEDGRKIISYGLSSYGYDFRLGSEFALFDSWDNLIDPKAFYLGEGNMMEVEESLTIPPGTFVLSHSVESFSIPRDIIGICLGKSTYARCGIIVNVTALEPEWEGQLTIEISNTANRPVKVYPGEGIAQLIFFRHETGCIWSYKDNLGKYMHQEGITYPKV